MLLWTRGPPRGDSRAARRRGCGPARRELVLIGRDAPHGVLLTSRADWSSRLFCMCVQPAQAVAVGGNTASWPNSVIWAITVGNKDLRRAARLAVRLKTPELSEGGSVAGRCVKLIGVDGWSSRIPQREWATWSHRRGRSQPTTAPLHPPCSGARSSRNCSRK